MEQLNLKLNDEVEHVSYPGHKGWVIAVSTKGPSDLVTILVHWKGANQVSRHIPTALKVVQLSG